MGKIIHELKSDNSVKTGVQDFKEKLKIYFKENFHATLSQLMKNFELEIDDLDALQFCVDELIKEKYLVKLSGIYYSEYHLTEEYGGL